MSLLLRKSVPQIGRSFGVGGIGGGSRRRLLVQTSAIGTDSWLVSSAGEQSFWKRQELGTPTLRSLATSITKAIETRNEDHDPNDRRNNKRINPTKILSRRPFCLSEEWDDDNSTLYRHYLEQIPCTTRNFDEDDGILNQPRIITNNNNNNNMMVRYVPAPTSIRSRHNLIQLVSSERAATDLAARALTTWATNYKNQKYFLSPTTHNNNSHQSHWKRRRPRQHQQQRRRVVQFFSTNSDGSRIRDPAIARSGIRKTKIPTPPSGPQQQSMKPEDVIEELNKKSKTVVLPALQSGLKAVLNFLLNLPKNLFFYVTNPSEIKEWWNRMKKVIKDEIDHYWVGTKLLWADLKTARNLLRRTLRGSSLTRRERKQLLRTISDLFRLVPFSMFLIIPLMEFALPFALKIFPNLLPSTFQDSLKAEESMKRELQSRIAMAKFFQETLEELAKEQKQSASHLKEEIKESGHDENIEESVVAQQEASAASFLDFMGKARSGEMIPNSVILDYAHYFKDDLTLDNMPRMQLVNMCKYMNIAPYGSDSFLRFQLRHRMRSLKEDDQRILWEGIESLTKMELREACQERGMRSTGLSKDAYKRALQQWLDLSVKQNVPTSLLIMSRTFFLREEMFERESEEGSKSIAGLADAISGLDKEVVNEVILDVATSQEKLSDPEVRKIKLEVLMKQNELIEKEQAEREEAAAKKKEQADKEKKEKEEEEIERLSSMNEPSPPLAEGQKISEEKSSVGAEGETILSEQADLATAGDSPAKETKVDEDLSAAEMDAISQLVSADPVSRERADLESIKAALQDEKNQDSVEKDLSDTSEMMAVEGSSDMESTQKPEKLEVLHEQDAMDRAEQNVEAFTIEESVEGGKEESESIEPEDPIVARLKKRIESMVDKIEVQMSDVEVKIGDKLHVLDKDMDGILSIEEVAEALQQVLKRKITFEEAIEIAQQMDANKDGDLTVQEFIEWVEMNQLVRFVEEGLDHDMDRIIEKQSAAEQQDQQEDDGNAQQAVEANK